MLCNSGRCLIKNAQVSILYQNGGSDGGGVNGGRRRQRGRFEGQQLTVKKRPMAASARQQRGAVMSLLDGI